MKLHLLFLLFLGRYFWSFQDLHWSSNLLWIQIQIPITCGSDRLIATFLSRELPGMCTFIDRFFEILEKPKWWNWFLEVRDPCTSFIFETSADEKILCQWCPACMLVVSFSVALGACRALYLLIQSKPPPSSSILLTATQSLIQSLVLQQIHLRFLISHFCCCVHPGIMLCSLFVSLLGWIRCVMALVIRTGVSHCNSYNNNNNNSEYESVQEWLRVSGSQEMIHPLK